MNKRLNPRSASPLMCDFLVHYTGSAPARFRSVPIELTESP